jgi:Zn-dependent hydrolases, including glyoxylases
MFVELKYGNTNTWFFRDAGLLLDTDMAGTLPAFYKEIKKNSVYVSDIHYVLATHYHPDHIGLVSELMRSGTKLLLAEHQKEFVHFADKIFSRQPGLKYHPINEDEAIIFSCDESRHLLAGLGIEGEIVPVYSHSQDGIVLLLDDGCCLAGDLAPREYIDGYPDNDLLQDDWKRITAFEPRRIYYSHIQASDCVSRE